MQWISSIRPWAEIATAGAAVTALVFSFLSNRTSSRALRLAEEQDRRRRPQLVPYLVEARVRIGPTYRAYEVLLSVNNRSDVDNAIARVELRLTFVAVEGRQISVRIPEGGRDDGAATVVPRLQTPVVIGSNATIEGWLNFYVDEEILGSAQVDKYNVVLIDTHGSEAIVEPILVKEYYGDQAADFARGP